MVTLIIENELFGGILELELFVMIVHFFKKVWRTFVQVLVFKYISYSFRIVNVLTRGKQ